MIDNSQTEPNNPVKQKPKILIVEDDTLLVNMYKAKFNMEGFEVLTALDGEAGLKIAQEQKLDFLLLDMMLPKLSGLDLLSRLRQLSGGKNTPVIVLSNLARESDAQQAKNLGAKEYLVKANLTPSEVVAKVKQYLGK